MFCEFIENEDPAYDDPTAFQAPKYDPSHQQDDILSQLSLNNNVILLNNSIDYSISSFPVELKHIESLNLVRSQLKKKPEHRNWRS